MLSSLLSGQTLAAFVLSLLAPAASPTPAGAPTPSVSQELALVPCTIHVEKYTNRQWAAERLKALNESTCVVWAHSETGADGTITITWLESCS